MRIGSQGETQCQSNWPSFISEPWRQFILLHLHELGLKVSLVLFSTMETIHILKFENNAKLMEGYLISYRMVFFQKLVTSKTYSNQGTQTKELVGSKVAS